MALTRRIRRRQSPGRRLPLRHPHGVLAVAPEPDDWPTDVQIANWAEGVTLFGRGPGAFRFL